MKIKQKLKYHKIKENLKSKFYVTNPFDDNDLCYLYEKKIDLSIIIPVYNVEEYIEKCIKSVVNQKTKYTYEILIINDGSTDNSINRIKKYLKYDNVILLEKENGGLSTARNYGIKNSKGKYLSFLDSDDYIDENFVETMISSAIYNDADMVKCGYYEFENTTYNIIKKVQYESKNVDYYSSDYIKVKGHACMCIIKRELFNNIRFPVGYLYEDMIMKFLIMSKCNKIALISDCLYYYRINKKSLSRNILNKKSYKCLAHIFLIEEIINKVNELNIDKNSNFIKQLIFEFGHVLWLRTRYLSYRDRYSCFYIASSDFKANYINFKNYNLYEKILIYILKHKCFIIWNLISILKMITIKYKKNKRKGKNEK